MDRESIKKRLPHREPMLLLDEADVNDEGKAVGRYRVRGDEFFLQGHFPGNPVVPGVMLIEMMAQTCCALFRESMTPYLTMIRNTVFQRKVVPGETITFLCEVKRRIGHFIVASGEGLVGGDVCLRGEFSFAVVADEG